MTFLETRCAGCGAFLVFLVLFLIKVSAVATACELDARIHSQSLGLEFGHENPSFRLLWFE